MIPKMIATTIKSIDIEAAEAFAFLVAAENASVPAPVLMKVPATISVNAAITSNVKSQQNNMNSFLPNLPMYFSMIIPIDFPSFLTDAYREPKSCTAPKNNPPTSNHRRKGNQPNTDASIGPVTGPAPAIDENWCENTVNLEDGT